MTYDECDPYAVTFAFANGDTLVEWTFARSLLDIAFESGSSGIGDVQFSMAKKDCLVMLLRNAISGAVVNIQFDPAAIKMFLDQTERMVPTGSESDRLDIQEEWAEWRDGHAV